ncbi:Gfo/Idh/MocA family protein [Kineococcus sp. SYSU DK001]|uniref:Gfo/Idh/MocA family protein n=1 Tax=Kineococcus sp. SYSU DK001 TaxID=3383122 RepID=UPI003D7C9EF9
MSAVPTTVPTVALAGVHGFGRTYVERLAARHRAGELRWVAAADPRLAAGDAPPGMPGDVAAHHDLADLLAHHRPDVVALATPLHTHADLAAAALRAGCDVLLEKPATTGLAEFTTLQRVADECGRQVQVGFQSLGSQAPAHVRARIDAGRIGRVTGYAAGGCWQRARSYFTRADWAGRRRLGDRVVADGVLTNPLAHAVATALAVAGRRGVDDVVSVVVDPFRVNDIETDDTTAVRVGLRDSPGLVLAGTLAASERGEPFVVAQGTGGRITLYYALDVVVEEVPGWPPLVSRHERTDLLDDLLRHRTDGGPLLSPLAGSGAFTRVLDAIVGGPAPRPVDPARVRAVDLPGDRRLELPGVEEAVAAALDSHRTFTELGVDWAR